MAKAKAVKSVFETAEVVPSKSSKKKSESKQVEFNKPFDTLVNLLVLQKHIEAAVKSLEKEFKECQAFDTFYEDIKQNKRQPESFLAVCEESQAQFQYAKNGFGFGKSVAEKLDSYGVEYATEIKSEERFVFNPKVLEDQDLMKKIDQALQKVQEFSDVQIVQKQEAEKKYQFTDATFAQVLEKVADTEEQSELLYNLGVIKIAAPKIQEKTYEDASVVSEALKHLVENDILQFSTKKEKGKKIA